MFERPHHQRIARVLQSLDGSLLKQHGCFFGGGTAIALRYGEYRESLDIDFLVSDAAAYRTLRTLLTTNGDLHAIAVTGQTPWQQVAELRADQYGIRTRVAVDGTEIKVEIVFESRIQLERSGVADTICGIDSLTPLDLTASKLLANSDRWRDEGVFSRDLIDLATMEPDVALLRRGVEKAQSAYGDAVLRDLRRAIDHMAETEGWLERCRAAMAIHDPPASIWQRVRALRRVLPKS